MKEIVCPIVCPKKLIQGIFQFETYGLYFININDKLTHVTWFCSFIPYNGLLFLYSKFVQSCNNLSVRHLSHRTLNGQAKSLDTSNRSTKYQLFQMKQRPTWMKFARRVSSAAPVETALHRGRGAMEPGNAPWKHPEITPTNRAVVSHITSSR